MAKKYKDLTDEEKERIRRTTSEWQKKNGKQIKFTLNMNKPEDVEIYNYIQLQKNIKEYLASLVLEDKNKKEK